MVSESFCRICLQNLLQKYGTSVATVPLFLETCNKEFCNVLCGKQVILAQLLLDLKIIVSHDGSCSVCKKCARKVVNCYKLLVKLKKKAFVVDSAVEKAMESGPRTPMRERYSARHQRSPTGVTPTKRPKENQLGATAQEPENRPLSKRSLFFDKYSVVEDEISSLMNLPTETYLPPISKVSANSLFCVKLTSINNDGFLALTGFRRLSFVFSRLWSEL